MDKAFRFKEFTVFQDKTAMKVGTDGVLLGAWASLDGKPSSILDIGAGTGLIALMLAQRSDAERIDALEIEAQAHAQCTGNFAASPWASRLSCYHTSLNDYCTGSQPSYELVVSNPPYFVETMASSSVSRDSARQNQWLPYEDLVMGARRLLSPAGKFCTIIPYREEERLLRLASDNLLYSCRITRVRGNTAAPVKRSLMEFGREQGETAVDELVIETGRHEYTEAYQRLTGAFYLKM